MRLDDSGKRLKYKRMSKGKEFINVYGAFMLTKRMQVFGVRFLVVMEVLYKGKEVKVTL